MIRLGLFTSLTALVSGLLLTGCGKSGAPTADGLAVIPVEQGLGRERRVSLSDFAGQPVEYVALDDAPEALVGEVYMLVPSETGLYVTEKSYGAANSAVRYFDGSGRFVSTRGRIGHGPDEYPGVSYLAVDAENDRAFVYGTGVIAYDRNNVRTARNDSIRSAQMAYRNGELLVFHYPSAEAEADGKRVLFSRYSAADLTPRGEIRVPDKGRVAVEVGFQVLCDNGSELLFKEELSDTICRLSGDSVRPVGLLDMGRYCFPAEKMTFEAMNEWPDYYRLVDLLAGERYLFLSLQNGLMGERTLLVYDRSDGACYIPKGDDGRQGLFVDGVRFTPRSIRGNRLVGELDLLDLLDRKEQITDPALRAVAAGVTEQSNLVVAILPLKE